MGDCIAQVYMTYIKVAPMHDCLEIQEVKNIYGIKIYYNQPIEQRTKKKNSKLIHCLLTTLKAPFIPLSPYMSS